MWLNEHYACRAGALGRRVTFRRDLPACTSMSGFGWAVFCAPQERRQGQGPPAE